MFKFDLFSRARGRRIFAALIGVVTISYVNASDSEKTVWSSEDVVRIETDSLKQANRECVVLLHGLAGSTVSMKMIERMLKRNRYQVVNRGYPSRSMSIEDLAPIAIEPALQECEDEQNIHFVTHSMGGVLLRKYLSARSVDGLGYVVMLAPPNQGNQLASRVNAYKWLSWYFGPALNDLANEGNNLPDELGPVAFNVGVIAGTRSHNPFGSRVLPGKDDGAVSVEQTAVKGMNGHITVPATHLSILFKSSTIKQILAYLRDGQFTERQNRS